MYLLTQTPSIKNGVAIATAILAVMVFIPSLQWLSTHALYGTVLTTHAGHDYDNKD